MPATASEVSALSSAREKPMIAVERMSEMHSSPKYGITLELNATAHASDIPSHAVCGYSTARFGTCAGVNATQLVVTSWSWSSVIALTALADSAAICGMES